LPNDGNRWRLATRIVIANPSLAVILSPGLSGAKNLTFIQGNLPQGVHFALSTVLASICSNYPYHTAWLPDKSAYPTKGYSPRFAVTRISRSDRHSRNLIEEVAICRQSYSHANNGSVKAVFVHDLRKRTRSLQNDLLPLLCNFVRSL
jgi:hypothetical protein